MRAMRGFTLVEMMVALAIFAVVSAVSFTGIMLMIDNRERVERQAERLEAVQTAFTRIERDLQQAAPRPIRDPFGDPRPAMLSGDLAALEWTRAGRSNPLGVRRSELERVAYRIEEEALVRVRWGVLDQQPEPPLREQVVLADATGIEIRFMGDDGEWTGAWPPPGAVTGSPLLPRAVEVTVRIPGLETVTRVVALPTVPAALGRPGEPGA